MELMRTSLLWAADNQWMRKNVPDFFFVKKAVKRFMPGESVEDALNAAGQILKKGIPTVFTYLGENINDLSEADAVAEHLKSGRSGALPDSRKDALKPGYGFYDFAAWMNKDSLVRLLTPKLKLDPELCDQCKLCVKECPMDNITMQPYPVLGDNCIRC